MKGNKKILALALLLLLIAASFGTYAIYKSSASSEQTVDAAAWIVEVNGENIVTESSFLLDNMDFGDDYQYIDGNMMAPGRSATADLVIDGSQADVAIDYVVTIGDITYLDENDQEQTVPSGIFTVVATNGSNDLTGSIYLDDNPRSKTIPLTITWNGAANDSDSKNETDVSLQGKELTIGITVTATQKLS